MQVGQIGTHIPPGHILEKVQHHKKTAEETPEAQPTATLSDEVEPASDDNGVKGVIRNLQAGHYKGVADVRLRINFHDELAAIEGAQLRTVSDEQVGGLAESVETNLQELVDSGQITQEQADEANDTLTQGINEAVEKFLTGEIESKDALTSELQSVFAAFAAFLSEITSQSTEAIQQSEEITEIIEEEIEQPAAEEVPPEEPPAEEVEAQSEPTGFVENMTTAFNGAITEFINTLNEVQVLPELSPPKGNGVAYQKFLEIYNDLYGLTAESTPEEAPSIDAVT